MQVLVGVGVLIFSHEKVLLGKRKGSHGAATWGLPGGHLDPGETIEACAARETAEETGLITNMFSQAGFTNTIFEHEQKQYVTLFLEAHDYTGEPAVLEPEQCDSWQWFAWGDLPGVICRSHYSRHFVRWLIRDTGHGCGRPDQCFADTSEAF